MQWRAPKILALPVLAVVLPLAMSASADPPTVSSAAPSARSSPSAVPAASAAPDPAALVRAQAVIEGHRVRLAGGLQPHVRAKLEEPVQKTLQVASKNVVASTELFDTANRSVGKAFANLPKDGIEAMALIALMEAEKNARVEVGEIHARLEALRQAKACRSELSCLEGLASKGGTAKEFADKAIGDVKNQRDSLRDLGEAEAARLRAATERQSKLTSALIGQLKKIANTPETITQKIK